MEDRTYGSLQLKGFTYMDRVCIDDTSCVNSFQYFYVQDQEAINGMAGMNERVGGILGMSRDVETTKEDGT